MANAKISLMTAGTAPDGTELVESVQGGNTRSLTTAQIAGLSSNITGTDYDIGTGNETADISALTATVGSTARYSWYDGDGTYTFAFTGTAGITIDGIASSEYIGEGVGHLDLYAVSASACLTVSRGEIWDSDGGNFTGTFQKKLDGTISQNHKSLNNSIACTTATGSIYANSSPVAAQNYPVTVQQLDRASITIESANSFRWATTDSSGDTSTSAWAPFRVCDSASSTDDTDYFYDMSGRWTTSYPRIT